MSARWTLASAAAAILCTPAAAHMQGSKAEQVTASQAIQAADEALSDTARASDDAVLKLDAENRPQSLWEPLTTYSPLVIDFLARAKALKPKDSASRAKLASDFALSQRGLAETLSFLAIMDDQWTEDDRKESLVARALALPEHAGRSPITIALAAAAISTVTDDCSPEQIDRLLAGSTNIERGLWLIATNCTGTLAFTNLLARARESRPAMLWMLRGWTNAEPSAELAADDMYLDPAMSGFIDTPARTRFLASVVRGKLARFYAMGMVKDGLAFADSISQALLERALRLPTGEVRTEIAGFPIYREGNRSNDHFASEHAAALALGGRREDALRLLDSIAEPERRSKARACLDAASSKCLSNFEDPLTLDVLVIDQFLRDPGADPYVLLEAQTNISTRSTLIQTILCQLMTGEQKKKVCDDAAERARSTRSGNDVRIGEDDRRLWQEMGNAFGPQFARARNRYNALIASYGTEPAKAATPWERASVDPEAAPFRELPLPASAAGVRPKPAALPKDIAILPAGFSVVRFEREGSRAIAISVSLLFDRNGEVSAGGYWVHVSQDGGKHWQAPLYTGLAEYFPYVVPSSSRLPMLAGDRIHLEVEEALIDTASITYPPVGIRTKRKRSGFYLDIPIADLARDSDGDGLSDIAAHHLLLDEAGSARPFVVGRDTGCTGASSETLARLEILKQLYKVEASALIEPIDRPTGTFFGKWRAGEAAAKAPIFLEGDPDDYRCVSVDRPMIVYRKDDRGKLRRFSPDFQLVTLPPITWNRAQTRGFVDWSMGWTGGRFRLVRNGDSWTLTSISSWIT